MISCPAKITALFITVILFAGPGRSFTRQRSAKKTISAPSSIDSALFYHAETIPRDAVAPTTTITTIKPLVVPRPAAPKNPSPKKTRVLVEDVASLDELKYFLEEDERPVVIKFYAKWCKKCQAVGVQVDRLARETGDRIEDEQFVDGDVRYAQVEYNEETREFITEELQIPAVPTLQVYVGTSKLSDGGSSVKKIRNELALLEGMSHGDVCQRAEERDDGVLAGLIEDSFYAVPDFLNEEW